MNIKMSRLTLYVRSLVLTRGHTLCSLNRSHGCDFSRKPRACVSLQRKQFAFRRNMRASANVGERL